MAKKRPPVSFPELEPKGRNAILRSGEEFREEEALLESQETGIPANHQTSMPESQNIGMPAYQNAGSRAEYTKVTYRLSPAAIDAINEVKRVLRREYKIKASLEEIAEEAILATYSELLENQHTSILVNQLSRKPATQKYD